MSVRDEAAEAAEVLRRLLDAIAGGEMTATAPARTVARLEGAVLAFEAVARGERFEVDDVLDLFTVD